MQSILACLSILPGVAFVVVQPLLLRLLIDEAIAHKDTQLAVWLLGMLFALLALNTLGDLAHRYFLARIVTNLTNNLRLRLFNHLHSLSQSFYARSQVAELMVHYTSDLDAIERALLMDLPYALWYLLAIGLGLCALFSIEQHLALMSLILLPSISLGSWFLGAKADRADKLRQEDATEVASIAQENLAAQLVVKVFELQNLELARFQNRLHQLSHSSVRVGFLSGLQSATLTGSGFFILVLAITVGVYLALQDQLTVGRLVAFTEILLWVVSSLQYISSTILPLRQAATGMQRIEKLLAEEPQIIDSPNSRLLPPFSSKIRFHDVSFSYTGETMNLERVNLIIPSGQSVAIVGRSGSGKSTLLGLLLRLYDPTSGKVTIDGYDLREVTQASLRDQMGVVFQESFLFNTTIRENIRFGQPDATEAEVEAAALAAEIHDFVLTLPKGYDTVVGERGGLLSGGQRQRIAIARAILRNPAILLLDEATSALDPQTEAAINETLQRLTSGRTVIFITHRLSSVVQADRIIIFEEGHLVEQGTHEQLLGQMGVYYRLWQRQQNGFTISRDGRYATIEPSRLREISLFSRLSETDLDAIASRFVTKHYSENKMVIAQGDEADSFYVIVRGSVEVIQVEPDGKENLLGILEDGDFFGETALIENVLHTTTVQTRTSCLLLALDRELFLKILDSAPHWQLAMRPTPSL